MHQLFGLEHKVAIVTGGAAGIGKSICEEFARCGTNVICADIDRNAGKELAASMDKITYMYLDATEEHEVRKLIQKVVKQHGTLDIFVNNVGITGTRAPIEETDSEDWLNVQKTNLTSAYYGTKYALTPMIKRKKGVIINVSSVCGLRSVRQLSAYSASKAAVIQLTKSTALEAAENGVRVNCICPSTVDTDLLEKYIAESNDPDETREYLNNLNLIPGLIPVKAISTATLFLSSELSSHTTGHCFPVDGGYLIK